MRPSTLIRTCAAAFGSLALLATTGTVLATAETTSVESARVAGADRYATAVQVSKASHREGSDRVFVVSGENFPDAMAAGAAAARFDAPVLLTRKADLPSAVMDEIIRLEPDEVFVVGGENAVSEIVVDSLKVLVEATERIAGADRYETAAKVADFVPDNGVAAAYLASGEVFADALAAGPAAARSRGPVLLTGRWQLPKVATDVISGLGNTPVRVVGGTGVISSDVVDAIGETTYSQDIQRVSGDDRYHTSARVSNDAFTSGADVVYVSTGQQYADALAGTPLAASTDSPILLVRKDSVDASVCQEIRRLEPTKVVAIGGNASVSDAALAAAVACASAPASPQQPATSPAPATGSGPNSPSAVCTSNGMDTLDRNVVRASISTMLAVIPAADAARYNPADPIADEIYILEAEARSLANAGAPNVCQQAYYVAQVEYIHAELHQARIQPNEAEAHYDRARAALGTILPIVNTVLPTNYQLP